MAPWTALPYAGQYSFDAESVRRQWSRLHGGDAEPLPSDDRLLEAWALFHNGEFRKAMGAGLQLGLSGLALAHQSACIYATYLERKRKARLDLYREVADRAEAHIALGAFHAEVIDKVGPLIGSMTCGARKDVGPNLFEKAMRIHLQSALAMVEYANALLMLEGDQKRREATRLYRQAAAFTPLDAAEQLDVETARAELDG
jgi:hypothetical protein